MVERLTPLWTFGEFIPEDAGGYVRYSDHVAALATARREALEAAAKWQPIDTAPKDGTSVLLCFEYHPVCMGRYEYGTWIYAFCMTEGGDTPTGWMPMPRALPLDHIPDAGKKVSTGGGDEG